MDRVYKKNKKTTVQLTSLLDLLFVMIFVSLIQQKEVSPVKVEVETPKQVVAKKPTPVKPEQKVFTINATFNFYGTNSNPNLPSGKYLMQGRYEKESGKLQLGGVAWLERPTNYDMVPLSGSLNRTEDTFLGRIEAVGCKKFTLSRKVKASGSPIAGEWVGTYDCAQGETGLTLSIK